MTRWRVVLVGADTGREYVYVVCVKDDTAQSRGRVVPAALAEHGWRLLIGSKSAQECVLEQPRGVMRVG